MRTTGIIGGAPERWVALALGVMRRLAAWARQGGYHPERRYMRGKVAGRG
jgi:hypothetical protein